jgi:hypothetical protein
LLFCCIVLDQVDSNYAENVLHDRIQPTANVDDNRSMLNNSSLAGKLEREKRSGKTWTITTTNFCCGRNTLRGVVDYGGADDTIEFDIRSGYVDPKRPWAFTIRTDSSHKYVYMNKVGVVLDATTQRATNELKGRITNDKRPTVLLNGKASGTSSSFYIGAANVVVKGFGVVEASGYAGLFIQSSGTAARIEGGYYCDNAGLGIEWQSSGCSIGLDSVGAAPVVISGNKEYGLFGVGTGVKIANAFIGVDHTGMVAQPNGYDGLQLHVEASGATVGSEKDGVLTIISGNQVHGIYCAGNPAVKIWGVYVGVGKDGVKAIGNQRNGILIAPVIMYATGSSTRTTIGKADVVSIISGNAGNGVLSQAENFHLEGTTLIGLGKDGTTVVPNKGCGVYLSGSALYAGLYLGGKLVVSGNLQRGIYVGTSRVEIRDAFVGVTSDGKHAAPNSGDGIFVAESATGTQISGGILSGNGRSGVYVDGPSTAVGFYRSASSVMLIGLGVGGTSAIPNARYGVEIGEFAKGSKIGPYHTDGLETTSTVVVAGNLKGGISSAAPEVFMCNIRVGLEADGQNGVPNTGNGIEVLVTGVGSRIGHSNPRYCSSTVAASTNNGIELHAAKVAMHHVTVGGGPKAAASDNDGTAQQFGGSRANKANGIFLSQTATNAVISDSIVSGNHGDGIRTNAPGTTLNGNTIGQGQKVINGRTIQIGDANSGNRGSGVHITTSAFGALLGAVRKFFPACNCI